MSFRLSLKLPCEGSEPLLDSGSRNPPSFLAVGTPSFLLDFLSITAQQSLPRFMMNLLISLIANLKCPRPGLLCSQLPHPQHLEEGLVYRKEAALLQEGWETVSRSYLKRKEEDTLVSRVVALSEASGPRGSTGLAGLSSP